jgi:cytochrome c biogenesis protein
MVVDLRALAHKTWRTVASIQTGVVLLILVVILSAAGTIVLQRPVTEPDEMQNAYSPQVLRILDAIGLTDVFHAWWFLGLMLLVSLCITAASIDRFPNSWRYFSRPYKYPDENFRRALHPQKSLAIADEESGLVAAQRALHSLGFKPERVIPKDAREDRFGIFAERHRISELAVYIVHASLLLIFLGTIVDGFWGWRGTLNLNEGQTSNLVELRDGTTRTLPFAIRCDAAGQENYQDGTPKKWWSKLAVVEGRRGAQKDVQKKEIVVNDPLLYQGVRFYQSSYGPNGKVDKLLLVAAPSNGSGEKQEIGLALNDTVPLSADTTVRFAEFFPDYAVRDGQVYRKSNQLENPAAHLVVTSKIAGQRTAGQTIAGQTTVEKTFDVWFPEIEGVADNSKSPYQFQATDLKMGHFTGLQVSHEPGQWGVWSGVVLLGVGLAFVFYVVHMRFWAVPVCDPKTGKCALWIGGTANRNRDAFEQRFNDLVASVEAELKLIPRTSASEQVATAVSN